MFMDVELVNWYMRNQYQKHKKSFPFNTWLINYIYGLTLCDLFLYLKRADEIASDIYMYI